MQSPDCLPVIRPDPPSPGQMSDKRSSERAFPRGEKSENDAGKERSARQASERVRAFSVFGVVERGVRTSRGASASAIMAAMSATEPTVFTKRRTRGGQRRPRPGAAGRGGVSGHEMGVFFRANAVRAEERRREGGRHREGKQARGGIRVRRRGRETERERRGGRRRRTVARADGSGRVARGASTPPRGRNEAPSKEGFQKDK